MIPTDRNLQYGNRGAKIPLGAMLFSLVALVGISSSKAGEVDATPVITLKQGTPATLETLKIPQTQTPVLASPALVKQGAKKVTEVKPAVKGLSRKAKAPVTRIARSSKPSSCKGKLGVHRTIKVSGENTFLVGVDTHARLGLKKKELILTFDDGPIAGTTERILEALAAECVKATFFSLGRQARTAPHLLVRAAREGHTIGTHSQSHPLLTKRKDEAVHAEVRRGVASIDAALEGTPYKASNFFRYPYLGRSKRTDKIVKSYGLVGVHMNIDSWDWKDTTVDEMLETTLRRTRGEGSGVVLFHDVQERTARGLARYLKIIRQEGYKIVHIVPGDSAFDYRKDLASRVPVPEPRPQYSIPVALNSATQGNSVVAVSSGVTLSTTSQSPVAKELKRQVLLDTDLRDSNGGLSVDTANRAGKASIPKGTDVTIVDRRALAARRLRQRLLKKKKQEIVTARLRIVPPLPRQKPNFPQGTQDETLQALSKNNDEIVSADGAASIAGIAEEAGATSTVSAGLNQKPKKKKRFSRLRKLFTSVGNR